MYNKTMDWQKEFDENVKYDNAELGCNWDTEKLKKFISSLIDEAYTRGHMIGYDEGLRDSINKK